MNWTLIYGILVDSVVPTHLISQPIPITIKYIYIYIYQYLLMKEIERLYQLVTSFQANVWNLPQAAKVVMHTELNVYTDG